MATTTLNIRIDEYAEKWDRRGALPTWADQTVTEYVCRSLKLRLKNSRGIRPNNH